MIVEIGWTIDPTAIRLPEVPVTDTDRPAHTADPAPAAPPTKHAHARWQVVRQYNHKPDEIVGGYRWQWLADLMAIRRAWGHPHEVGVHYTSRRGQ